MHIVTEINNTNLQKQQTELEIVIITCIMLKNDNNNNHGKNNVINYLEFNALSYTSSLSRHACD